EPEGNGPPKGRAKSLAAFGAVVEQQLGWWHDRRQRKGGPGRRGILTGALRSRIGGSLGGTPLTSYSKAKQRGAEPARVYRAPFSFLKCPHARKEKIGNSEYKIAAWLGRETRVVFDTYDDPNRAAKEAAQTDSAA